MASNDWTWDDADEAMVPKRTLTQRLLGWAHALDAPKHDIVDYGHTIYYADGTHIVRPEVLRFAQEVHAAKQR